MLFYLHDEPSKTSWFVKHSRDIKTLHLVQWLCNHSHKLLLAPVRKFGRCCSLERPADIEKSADALLLSGRNRKSAMSGRCLVEALGSVCPSVSLKRKEMCSAHRCCPGFIFLFLFFLHLPAEIFVYLNSNVFGRLFVDVKAELLREKDTVLFKARLSWEWWQEGNRLSGERQTDGCVAKW